MPRLPRRSSTSPYCDIVFSVRDRFDLLRPAISASSVSERGFSRAINSKRRRLCSDSNFAKLSSEVNHTFGSSLAGRLTATSAAEGLGVTRQALSDVLNGRTGVSVEMAIRLSKAFGSTPETWLGMQMAYDLWQARDRARKIEVECFVTA